MSNKNAVIRFDVSHSVGIGHMKRALCLARHLDDCLLIVSEGGVRFIKESGVTEFAMREVAMNSSDWLLNIPEGWPVIFDICYTKNKNAAEKQISVACNKKKKVIVLDSMPPDHYEGLELNNDSIPDLVITPYFSANNYIQKPPSRTWAVGPEYCILDDEYSSLALIASKRSNQKRILITCGGSDPTDLTKKCLQILQYYDGCIDIVIGPLFSLKLVEELKKIASLNNKIKLHLGVECLASLLVDAELIVGRPGLVRYEAAALNKSAIFLSETADYYEYYKNFCAKGLANIYFKIEPNGEEHFYLELKRIVREGVNGVMIKSDKKSKNSVPLNGVNNVLNLIFAA